MKHGGTSRKKWLVPRNNPSMLAPEVTHSSKLATHSNAMVRVGVLPSQEGRAPHWRLILNR